MTKALADLVTITMKVTFMRSWIESMQTVTVLGDRLTVASDCLTTGSTSVNITAIIFSSIFGTLVNAYYSHCGSYSRHCVLL